MTSPSFAHFLITRFNISTPFTGNTPILTDAWLTKRFELFEQFCFPSVAGQTNNNFQWIILFHPETPSHFMKRFHRLRAGAPHLEIVLGQGPAPQIIAPVLVDFPPKKISYHHPPG